MTHSTVNSSNFPTDSLGQRIRYCRKNAKLSQKQLSELTGVTQSAVTFWENKGAQPQIEICRKLSHLFSVSLEWLLLGDGENPEIQIIKNGPVEAVQTTNYLGLSPLQIATLNLLEQGLRQRRVSDARCIALLGEIQALVDASAAG